MKRWLLLLSLTGILFPLFGSDEGYTMPEISAYINSLESGQPPRPMGKNLLFSYKPDHDVRLVGIAFAHENYRKIYPFRRTPTGIYVLLYPIPNEKTDLRYRIIQDGFWLKDPANDKYITQTNGIRVSLYEIPPSVFQQDRETRRAGSTIRFRFSGVPDKSIFVTGSFNNWDPFLHKMEEISPGEYTLTINAAPGDHYYYYLQDGLKYLDDGNPRRATLTTGDRVNIIAGS